jgi:hypothetical protein
LVAGSHPPPVWVELFPKGKVEIKSDKTSGREEETDKEKAKESEQRSRMDSVECLFRSHRSVIEIKRDPASGIAEETNEEKAKGRE